MGVLREVKVGLYICTDIRFSWTRIENVNILDFTFDEPGMEGRVKIL